ncbi:hypothetical protein AAHE18_04G176500 [Arachis hypogaea]
MISSAQRPLHHPVSFLDHVVLLYLQPLLTRLSVGIKGDEKYVDITNRLHGKLKLFLHCKSKDNDLGKHLLRHDDTYRFSFKPNFSLKFFIKPTTLFFCKFRWKGACHWFDIYDDKRDGKLITLYWNITQKGPCVKSSLFLNRETELCYDWNKDKC